MEKKEERLLRRVEKAGVRASLRAGHVVSREELLNLRIQIIPLTLRIATGVVAAVSAIFSYLHFSAGEFDSGSSLAALAILLTLFTAFGVRRTLSAILENDSGADSVEFLKAAVEGIGALVGSVFDGV